MEERVCSMELLSDEMLVDTYYAAIQFELEPEFIRMLAIEMKRRRLNPEAVKITAWTAHSAPATMTWSPLVNRNLRCLIAGRAI